MYYAYRARGLHLWVDMRQAKLTLEGMREGVRDSDVFILVLSAHVLASWFCQQARHTALRERERESSSMYESLIHCVFRDGTRRT